MPLLFSNLMIDRLLKQELNMLSLRNMSSIQLKYSTSEVEKSKWTTQLGTGSCLMQFSTQTLPFAHAACSWWIGELFSYVLYNRINYQAGDSVFCSLFLPHTNSFSRRNHPGVEKVPTNKCRHKSLDFCCRDRNFIHSLPWFSCWLVHRSAYCVLHHHKWNEYEMNVLSKYWIRCDSKRSFKFGFSVNHRRLLFFLLECQKSLHTVDFFLLFPNRRRRYFPS